MEMWRLFLFSLWIIQAQASADDELLDYLIQDVCTDGAGNAVAGDPASCGSHRNINIGEDLPYLVTDFDTSNGATYFSFSSIPVHGEDNTLKVLISKSGQGSFGPDFKFSFDPARDGYDLIDTTYSDFASAIRTSDGGCFDQMFSPTGDISSISARAGGWPLFPYDTWKTGSSALVHTYKVQITPNVNGCSNGNSAGVTYWNAPAVYTFETGKSLTAIKQYHYASSQLAAQNNALELYYFSKEYGATRWEAWIPQSRCFAENGNNAGICHPEDPGNYPLQGRCSKLVVSSTGIAGLDTWGGQNWVRTDCRDNTNYVALNTPQLMLDDTMAQNDGYVDINYGETVSPS